jgi:hypothetical protein
LRPLAYWGIVAAELKRVTEFGRYMNVEGMVRSERISSSDAQLQQLATLCEELQQSSLFLRYANKKQFRHEKDFWASNDLNVQQYVKRMADTKLLQAVRLASAQEVPILYASSAQVSLHIDEQLQLEPATVVTPVMNFGRHEGGTTYKLQLRMDDELVETLSAHRLVVLGYEPALFVLDHRLLMLGEGFSAKLLLPFRDKAEVEIPQRVENDYFRRFILKNVAKAEINAEGFHIDDLNEPVRPRLHSETSIDGRHILSLRFGYGNYSYAPDDKQNGKVSLTATDDGNFRFTRLLRSRQQEARFADLIRQTGAELTAHGTLYFPTLDAMIAWLQQHGQALRQQGVDVVQPSDSIYYIGPLNVEQSDTWNGDWLQTKVTIVLDDGRLRIPFADLRNTILHGEQHYMLPTGERLLIPAEWLKRYGDLLLTGRPKAGVFIRHRSQLDEKQKEEGKKLKTDDGLALPPSSLKATLRPYQLVGYRWLWRNFLAQTGCCLSDEMGLGKTVQTIALLLKYKDMAKRQPARKKPQVGFLFSDDEMRGQADATPDDFGLSYSTSVVLAPASVVHNWRNELQHFAPSLLICDYTGTLTQRRKKQHTLMRWDVVITTYRTLVNDIEAFASKQFGIVVFDESQAFKTHTSQIHHAVRRLKAHFHLALSGTPVENNLTELWSLMNVLNPNLLGDVRHYNKSFVDTCGVQIEQERAQVLRHLIEPYFLKRTKEQVLTDLPERQDEVVVCPMTDEQVKCYAEELSKARNEWMDPTATDRQINILAAIQNLRHIANGEGKMTVVFERLEQLRGTTHKVLLFSEYVSMLRQVADEMQLRGWDYELLTGQTTQREQVIDRFQQTANCQFFLISLKAGGVGLNLTAADYVFVLDPWWNQAAEEQAIARSHRMGQHRPVFVYRFVAENTLEQQILTLQERKQTLIDSVMPFICNP